MEGSRTWRKRSRTASWARCPGAQSERKEAPFSFVIATPDEGSLSLAELQCDWHLAVTPLTHVHPPRPSPNMFKLSMPQSKPTSSQPEGLAASNGASDSPRISVPALDPPARPLALTLPLPSPSPDWLSPLSLLDSVPLS